MIFLSLDQTVKSINQSIRNKSNFKLYEHTQQYHQLQIKLINDVIKSTVKWQVIYINNDFITNAVYDYDQICESIDFAYASSIKNE